MKTSETTFGASVNHVVSQWTTSRLSKGGALKIYRTIPADGDRPCTVDSISRDDHDWT